MTDIDDSAETPEDADGQELILRVDADRYERLREVAERRGVSLTESVGVDLDFAWRVWDHVHGPRRDLTVILEGFADRPIEVRRPRHPTVYLEVDSTSRSRT